MDTPFLSGKNPVLDRELRVVLRNVRSFGLLALYVSILGAIVLADFPSDKNVPLDNGGHVGLELFQKFLVAQAVLVLLLFPALATGAIAQERERRTLEPLLLTPMRPMQIVWGKASGVMAIAVLLLAGTLPLTSLYFFLGGLSPGDLIASYAVLLGLALFVIGLGLWQSAKNSNATRAMCVCYLQLPLFLGALALFFIPGMLWSGLAISSAIAIKSFDGWRKIERERLPKQWRHAGRLAYFVAMGCLVLGALAAMLYDMDIGRIVVGVLFIASYFVYAAQFGLQQAARELMRRPEPRRPSREAIDDLKSEIVDAVTPQQVQTGPYSHTSQAPPRPKRPEAPTYGVRPFLSDRLNPIFAKDMRSGLLGKFDYVFRFSYIVTIGTQLLMLAIMLLAPGTSATDAAGVFGGWAKLHLALLMTFGAWFGSRSFAPEREQQTLQQLLTVPLPPSAIVSGKLQAALAHTFYIYIMGLPLALMLAGLHFISWSAAWGFLGLELVFGVTACTWGAYCSLFGVTVRRAMSWALGGLLALFMLNILVLNDFLALAVAFQGQEESYINVWNTCVAGLAPFYAMGVVIAPPTGPGSLLSLDFVASCLIAFAMAAGLFLMLTCLAFRRYARDA